jgi:tight adherence protein C
MDEWLPLIGVFLVTTGLCLGLYLLLRRRRQAPPDRLRAADPDAEPPRPLVFGALTTPLSEQLPVRPAARAELLQELRVAGFYRPTALTEYLAIRAVFILVPLLAAGVLALLVEPEQVPNVLIGGGVLAVLGFSLPRVHLAMRGRSRARAIERGLPLAIDLLTLCLSAGQNLLAAMNQAASQLRTTHPELAQELAIVRQQAELHSLEHALRQWADRVRLPGVRNLALLLIQSEKLGTDAASTLLELSTNFRITARQRAEAQANRTSFWMLMPSVFCFWVAAAIILIGPAYLEFFAQRRRSTLIFHQSRQNIDKANEGGKRMPVRTGRTDPNGGSPTTIPPSSRGAPR